MESESLQIIQAVENFYNSAWTKLVYVIGVIGVIIPYFFYIFQKRLFKIEKRDIEANIKKDIDDKIEIFEERIEREVNNKLEGIKGELKKEVYNLKGMGFLLQGNSEARINNNEAALISFISAMLNFIRGNDLLNLRASLGNLVICMGQMDKDKYKRALITKDINMDIVVDDIKKVDKNSILSKELGELRSMIHKLNNDK